MKSIHAPLGIAETGTGVGSVENSEKVRLYIERKRLLYLTQGEMTWCRNHRVTPEGGLQRVVKIGLGPLRGGDTAAPIPWQRCTSIRGKVVKGGRVSQEGT